MDFKSLRPTFSHFPGAEAWTDSSAIRYHYCTIHSEFWFIGKREYLIFPFTSEYTCDDRFNRILDTLWTMVRCWRQSRQRIITQQLTDSPASPWTADLNPLFLDIAVPFRLFIPFIPCYVKRSPSWPTSHLVRPNSYSPSHCYCCYPYVFSLFAQRRWNQTCSPVQLCSSCNYGKVRTSNKAPVFGTRQCVCIGYLGPLIPDLLYPLSLQLPCQTLCRVHLLFLWFNLASGLCKGFYAFAGGSRRRGGSVKTWREDWMLDN
jgi:hypothetical protein